MSHSTQSSSITGSKHWAIENYHAYGSTEKSYSQSSKSLGGDSDLGLWLEDARAYYNNVMQGSVERPNPAAWNEFVYQLQWAESQNSYLGESDPMLGEGFDGETQGAQINAFGGEIGPNGSFNYDTVQTHLGFTGDQTRNDVFGTDNTLSLEQPSAQVSFEMTMDHGVEVLKVVTTTSKGTMVTYYDSFNSADFKLNLAMADTSKVSGLENLPAELKSKITVGKYDPNQKPEESGTQASITGQAVEGEANTYYYEVEAVDQTIDFHPNAGVNETHNVVGDATISLPVSSKAEVSKSDKPDYDTKVVVTHKDGSTDTFYLKKPFSANINAVEGYVSFDGQASEGGSVPSEYSETISLGGSTASASGNPDDTQPDETGKVSVSSYVPGDQYAKYNTQESVSLTANHEDNLDVHQIYARNVDIHVGNFENAVTVNKMGDSYLVSVKQGDHTEYFLIDSQVESITINGGKITLADEVKADEKLNIPGLAQDETKNNAQQIIDNLLSAAGGKSEEQLLTALNANGFHYSDIAALKAAITEGSFPPFGDKTQSLNLMHALYDLDPTISGALNSIDVKKGASLNANYKTAVSRLVTLLSALYPKSNIYATAPNCSDSDWRKANDITFDGVTFGITQDDPEGERNKFSPSY